jgi:DNA-binding transcriptional regulator YiaG
MTAKQLRVALKQLDLTQVALARFVSVDERTARAWALDEARIPEAVAKLLRLMIRLKLDPSEVE